MGEMDGETKRDDELMELVGELCDGGLDDAQSERLNKLLQGDERARQWYAEHMFLHSELYWHMSANLSTDDLKIAVSTKSNAESLTGRDSAARRTMTRWPILWIGLAAALLLGIALGTWGWRDFRGKSPSILRSSSGDIVARVTGTRNCRWEQGDGIGYGSALSAGQRLNLLEGLAEITFHCGTRIILEAPALLDVATIDSSFLHRGRLTAAVPEGAEGFRVELDHFTIVDRGTEFGVANLNGNTDVYVFDGLIEGHFINDHGDTIRTVSWRTDEAVRIDARAANFVSTNGTDSQFIRSLSPSSREELYAQEDFDYPAGPLGGQNGGFGWGGPWVDISASGNASETNRVAAGSLKIDGIVQAGNHASLIAQENRIRRVLGTSLGGVFDTMNLVEDQDGVRLVGVDRSTVYLSFCQRVDRSSQTFYGLELHRGDGNSNRVLCIGNGASETGFGATSEVNGGARNTFQSLGEEPVKAAFFIVRFDFGDNNSDRVTIYRNPQSVVNEGQCTPEAEMFGNFAFDRISIGNFYGLKSHKIDRLRVGTTFAAVTSQHLMPGSRAVTHSRKRQIKPSDVPPGPVFRLFSLVEYVANN